MRAAGKAPPTKTILAIGLIVVMEILGLHLLRPLDNWLMDSMVRLQAESLPPDPDIVIVDIDERSLEMMAEYYGRWPWPRSVHAELIEGLQRFTPRAIVFDILFSDPDITHPESDTYFAETVSSQRNVFLPIQLISTRQQADWPKIANSLGFQSVTTPPDAQDDNHWGLILPYPPLENIGRLGTINYLRDDDGVGRRYHIYQDAHGWKIPSLPAKVAAHLGYPLPEDREIMLHWRGQGLAYQRLSYFDLYQQFNSERQRQDLSFLQNKIILVGATAAALHDLRATPVNSLTPAIGILATAIDNIKNQRWQNSAHPVFILIISLALICLQVIAARYVHNPLVEGMALLAISAALILASYFVLRQHLYLTPFTPIAIGILFYSVTALQAHLEEKKARERSVQMFSRFLDKRVVNELVAGDETQILKSKSQDISVMFTDIRGFTSLSENRSAEEILSLLNKYYEKQVQVIFRHGGTVDKFIGDAIMAFWGAPVEDKAHAVNAVTAALEMLDALQAFKQELNNPEAEFDIGIGIHTGPAVVGVVGFEQRMDYTCIGDTVNLASRIEGQTKGRARILVSAETKAQCGQVFDYHDHGEIHVKGREKAVHLFEPLRKT